MAPDMHSTTMITVKNTIILRTEPALSRISLSKA